MCERETTFFPSARKGGKGKEEVRDYGRQRSCAPEMIPSLAVISLCLIPLSVFLASFFQTRVDVPGSSRLPPRAAGMEGGGVTHERGRRSSSQKQKKRQSIASSGSYFLLCLLGVCNHA